MSGSQFLIAVVWALGLIVVMGVNLLFMDWWERKVVGHIHVRPGPLHTGFHGLLQPIADMVKMLSKEDVIPDAADKLFFWLGPMIALVPTYLALSVLPIAPGFAMLDLRHGLFFVFAMQTIMPLGLTLIGWASHNKWSLFGALRAAAQLISYEIPMLIAALGVVMAVGSTRLTDIGDAQAGLWFAVKQPVGFIVFVITAIAEMNRTPFDMPEADSEIVGGYLTEYSGMKFGFAFMAEYTAMLVGSWLISLLYLGGWNMPFLPPSPLWLVAKIYLVQTAIVWIRGTYPRLRVASLMEMSWRYLIPVGLANLVVVGLLIAVWPGY